jgi:hypothetical protein
LSANRGCGPKSRRRRFARCRNGRPFTTPWADCRSRS